MNHPRKEADALIDRLTSIPEEGTEPNWRDIGKNARDHDEMGFAIRMGMLEEQNAILIEALRFYTQHHNWVPNVAKLALEKIGINT